MHPGVYVDVTCNQFITLMQSITSFKSEKRLLLYIIASLHTDCKNSIRWRPFSKMMVLGTLLNYVNRLTTTVAATYNVCNYCYSILQ